MGQDSDYIKGGAPLTVSHRVQLVAAQITDVTAMDYGTDAATLQGEDLLCTPLVRRWMVRDNPAVLLMTPWR